MNEVSQEEDARGIFLCIDSRLRRQGKQRYMDVSVFFRLDLRFRNRFWRQDIDFLLRLMTVYMASSGLFLRLHVMLFFSLLLLCCKTCSATRVEVVFLMIFMFVDVYSFVMSFSFKGKNVINNKNDALESCIDN